MYNFWIITVVIPYIFFSLFYSTFISFLDLNDQIKINDILTNSDYYNFQKIIKIKYGIEKQNFVYVSPNKWYYDSEYTRCISEDIEMIQKLHICYFNGTHVKMKDNIYKYYTFLTGESYCNPNRYIRGICVHILREIYEIYIIYYFVFSLILIVSNILRN